MKDSCISHPDREPLIMVRQWQLEACEKNYCAAALLSFFEYWHNWKLDTVEKNQLRSSVAAKHGESFEDSTGLLQFHTEDDLEIGLLGLYKRKTIREGIKLLTDRGFISIHKNPNPRYKFDNTKFFLFHAETVNAWIKNREPQKIQDFLASGKNASRSGKNTSPQGNFAGTIPEITSRDYSSEITSKEKETKAFSGGKSTTAIASKKMSQPSVAVEPYGQETDRSPTSLSNQPDIAHGQSSNLKDVKAPLFSHERINDRLWKFSEKTGRVKLPAGDRHKLARAVTNRAIQLWLIDRMRESSSDGWEIAVTPSDVLWVYDPLTGWMDEDELHGIAKLLELCEYRHCGVDADEYNEFAIAKFEEFSAAIDRHPGRIDRVLVPGILAACAIDFDLVDWEDPEEEE